MISEIESTFVSSWSKIYDRMTSFSVTLRVRCSLCRDESKADTSRRWAAHEPPLSWKSTWAVGFLAGMVLATTSVPVPAAAAADISLPFSSPSRVLPQLKNGKLSAQYYQPAKSHCVGTKAHDIRAGGFASYAESSRGAGSDYTDTTDHDVGVDGFSDALGEDEEEEEEVKDDGDEEELEEDDESGENDDEVSLTAAPAAIDKTQRIRSATTTKTSDKPSLPPNALYRFWLTKGRVGRVIVTALVLMAEFVSCYFPTLASFLTWLLKSMHIYDAEKAARVTEARRVAAMRGHTVGKKKGRFGNRKAQMARKKLADQAALSKLRSLGRGREGKYCHLSSTFMKAHRLGRYAADKLVEGSEDALMKDVVGEIAAKETYASKDEVEDEWVEDTDEEDWVIQALSKDQAPARDIGKDAPVYDKKEVQVGVSDASIFSRVEPSVVVERSNSGQTSVSIGFDFSLGGQKGQSISNKRDAMLKAAAASKSSHVHGKYRKLAGQRSSDRNGGGGVLGRLRAAGASSIISSRVLGAYPGDAAPIDEAASADGVFGLASRYGYGDWSDSDDSNYDNEKEATRSSKFPRRKRRGSRKRRRRPEASSTSTSLHRSTTKVSAKGVEETQIQ